MLVHILILIFRLFFKETTIHLMHLLNLMLMYHVSTMFTNDYNHRTQHKLCVHLQQRLGQTYNMLFLYIKSIVSHVSVCLFHLSVSVCYPLLGEVNSIYHTIWYRYHTIKKITKLARNELVVVYIEEISLIVYIIYL